MKKEKNNSKISEARIHLVIGTKAQLIKMLPIIFELRKRDIPFRYIDTCQHFQITKEMRSAFGIDEPDIFVAKKNANITGLTQAFLWIGSVLVSSALRQKKIFPSKKGVCLVHGDTVTALLGLIMGKMARQKIAHVEAGERTHNLFSPFPEEIIRIIVDKYADYVFPSSDESFENLVSERIRGSIKRLNGNTIVDAIQIASTMEHINIEVPTVYVLVSIHRFETIRSKNRMEFVIDTVEKISNQFKVVWGLHEPTKKQLYKFGLMERIACNNNIRLRGLWDYFSFIKAMKQSEFLVTDGGGPQEESWFLNVPCMLMRAESERELHSNVYRTNFRTDRVEYFLANYKTMKSDTLDCIQSPSKQIVEFLVHQIQ